MLRRNNAKEKLCLFELDVNNECGNGVRFCQIALFGGIFVCVCRIANRPALWSVQLRPYAGRFNFYFRNNLASKICVNLFHKCKRQRFSLVFVTVSFVTVVALLNWFYFFVHIILLSPSICGLVQFERYCH